jgi:hypothetical protein
LSRTEKENKEKGMTACDTCRLANENAKKFLHMTLPAGCVSFATALDAISQVKLVF